MVADEKQDGMGRPVQPEAYAPVLYNTSNEMTIVVRTAGDPTALVEFARRQVQSLDKDLTATDVATLRDVVHGSVVEERFRTSLLSGFAAVALLLAAIGIFGVLSYLVTQRTREIGIRMALGAQRSELLRMVVGQGMRPILAGVAVGLAGSLALTRAISTLLFGVSAADPWTYASMTAILTAVAICACCAPALRATRVDPIVALREE